MSNELVVEALETVNASDMGDLDWSSDESDFPALEVNAEEASDDTISEESIPETEDKPIEVSGAETDTETREASSEVIDSKKEDISGEPEGAEPDKSEAIDLNSLEENSNIKVKIDGKLEEISIKEFKNGISGEKAIAKRFTEFDQKEKAFKAETDQVNQYINTFAQKMQSGDPVAALEYLTQFSSVPAYEVKDMLIKSLLPEIERRQELMPEQLQLEKTQAQLKFEQDKAATETSKFQSEQAAKDLEFKVINTKQSYKISQEEWDQSFHHLDKSLPANEAITIDTVKEYVLFSRAENALNQVDSKLLDDQNVMNQFISIQSENPDFTQDDLIAIANDAFKQSEKQQANDNLQEVKNKKSEPLKATPSKPKADGAQFSSFESDDWDDVL